MTLKFKFAQPADQTLITLDPVFGSFETSAARARIDYAMNNTCGCPSIELNIRSQDLEAADLDDLIAFLACVRSHMESM